MKLHRAIFLGAGVVGVVIAIWVTIDQTSQEPVGGITRASATADPVTALQRDVAVLKERITRPPIVVTPSRDAEDDATSASPAADPTPKPAKAIEPAEIAELLEVHYASEPADRAWSDKLRTELGAALSTQEAGTMILSTQCTASLCKAALQHDTLAAQRGLASIVAMLPALSAGVFYHYEDGAEPPRTMLYILREGRDFKDMLAAH